MKRTLIPLACGFAALLASASASAQVGFNFGIGNCSYYPYPSVYANCPYSYYGPPVGVYLGRGAWGGDRGWRGNEGGPRGGDRFERGGGGHGGGHPGGGHEGGGHGGGGAHR